MPRKRTSAPMIVLRRDDHLDEAKAEQERDKTRSHSLCPWQTYDQFIQGKSVRELSFGDNVPEQSILDDIREMRDEMRRMRPGITDEEADATRMHDLLIIAGFTDPSPPSLRVAAEAHDKRREITDAGLAREQSKQKSRRV